MSASFDSSLFQASAIAFDLDGTLVDTAPDLVRALNAVVIPRGLTPVPVADVRAMVGRGARALIERAFQRDDHDFDISQADLLVAEFIDVYQSDVAAESQVFAGVMETLALLGEAGADLSVCTNKPSVLADQLLEAVGLSGYFTRIIGPERTSAKKPAADHVDDATGTDAVRRALVGDSAPDVGAARAAGIPSLIMSYGYSESPAASLGADRVLHSFREVPEALTEIWSQS